MFDIRILLIIILLGVSIYYIYKMYSFNTYIVNKSTSTIVDNVEDKFEDLTDKLTDIETKIQSLEDLINVKLDVCYKKVNDVYSMQNKVNEITKMNNQSIIHQINQYDEEINDFDPNQKGVNFNSIETSMSPKGGFDKLNNKCFIKHNTKNQDKEMFYMSSLNKNELKSKNKTDLSKLSETSSQELKEVKNNNDLISTSSSSKTEKTNKSKINSQNNKKNEPDENIFSNLYGNNKKPNLRIIKDNLSLENDSNLEQFINSLPENIVDGFFEKNKLAENSNASVILEMNSNTVKPYKVETSSPKFANAMKILNETNIIKNNSYNKLNEITNKFDNSSSVSTSSSKKSSSASNDTNTRSTNETSNYSEDNNIIMDDFGQTFHYANVVDLNGSNIIFGEIPHKQNRTKIVELN